MPVQVTFRDMPVSDTVEAMCWKKVGELERDFDRLLRCHVTIVESRRAQPQGTLYDVRIELSLPGRDIAVTREHATDLVDEDIIAAVHEAFGLLRRQLRQLTSETSEQSHEHEMHC